MVSHCRRAGVGTVSSETDLGVIVPKTAGGICDEPPGCLRFFTRQILFLATYALHVIGTSQYMSKRGLVFVGIGTKTIEEFSKDRGSTTSATKNNYRRITAVR